MHILTINLSEKSAAQLRSLIKSRITHSNTMTDACLLIKKNEFSLIVKKTDAKILKVNFLSPYWDSRQSQQKFYSLENESIKPLYLLGKHLA